MVATILKMAATINKLVETILKMMEITNQPISAREMVATITELVEANNGVVRRYQKWSRPNCD